MGGQSTSKNGYGAELPIIKTTSIIHQSPKYMAELLMDSNMVKVYNKMSLGRTDEKVFQTGVLVVLLFCTCCFTFIILERN